MDARATVAKLLTDAGITINGRQPYDLQVRDERLYARILAHGSLGAGEAYVEGWWSCAQLDVFFEKVLSAQLNRKITGKTAVQALWHRIFNPQRLRPYNIGQKHYDLSNDLFQAMLDRRLTYTCAYWKRAKTLDQAQEAKLDLVCRKLNLKKGQRILDIGCGWGSFAKYAAQKYKVSVVGVTVSAEQVELGMKLCKGLPVELRLQDYRELNERFDHIVSLGMFEHVGPKNYKTYFAVARRCLKDDGLFLLHTIGGNESVQETDAWINKYIFPDGVLPSVAQIGKAIEGMFVLEDWHNFGPDYDKTLLAWHKNFVKAWPRLQKQDPAKYTDRFFRLWSYYLLSCAGSFRARKNQLWQIVLSKNGVKGGYTSVR